jgi:hypothetical protein
MWRGWRERMTKEEITIWALANGWQLIEGCPSLTKPSSPKEAIVRLVFKATVANVEVKKPAGKWEKISGESDGRIVPDDETGLPRGLKLEIIPGFSLLMRDNKDRLTFTRLGMGPKQP